MNMGAECVYCTGCAQGAEVHRSRCRSLIAPGSSHSKGKRRLEICLKTCSDQRLQIGQSHELAIHTNSASCLCICWAQFGGREGETASCLRASKYSGQVAPNMPIPLQASPCVIKRVDTGTFGFLECSSGVKEKFGNGGHSFF